MEKKQRELYQLVAISNGIEYVVELKNDNKNNRGSLELIDSGTTRFQNERHLAQYLYDAGKIPTTDVKFAIKYKYDGNKYMPVIFNDRELFAISKNVGNNDLYNDYVFFFLKKVEAKLNNPMFYRYLLESNDSRNNRLSNGNYLNMKIIDTIKEYFNNFVATRNIDGDKVDLQYDLLKELFNYKQLRTLRMFYLNFIGQKENGILPEEVPQSSYDDMPDIPDEIASAYREGGMDGVYGVADLDDLIGKNIHFK